MNGSGRRFAIHRGRTFAYFYLPPLLVLVPGFALLWALVVGLAGEMLFSEGLGPSLGRLCGGSLGLVLLYAIFVGPWVCRWIVRALDYRLEGTTLCVDSGVIYLKRKRIPLDRITDLVLFQGPLARCCGIWILKVQTAGSGQTMPEATLYGLRHPETVRDEIIAARDGAVVKPAKDA